MFYFLRVRLDENKNGIFKPFWGWCYWIVTFFIFDIVQNCLHGFVGECVFSTLQLLSLQKYRCNSVVALLLLPYQMLILGRFFCRSSLSPDVRNKNSPCHFHDVEWSSFPPYTKCKKKFSFSSMKFHFMQQTPACLLPRILQSWRLQVKYQLLPFFQISFILAPHSVSPLLTLTSSLCGSRALYWVNFRIKY